MMISITIFIVVAASVAGKVVKMDNECVIKFDVLLDCTELQDERAHYVFTHLSYTVERIEFNRLTGLLNLKNLPMVERVEVMFGEANCVHIAGNVQTVVLQYGSEPPLTCSVSKI